MIAELTLQVRPKSLTTRSPRLTEPRDATESDSNRGQHMGVLKERKLSLGGAAYPAPLACKSQPFGSVAFLFVWSRRFSDLTLESTARRGSTVGQNLAF